MVDFIQYTFLPTRINIYKIKYDIPLLRRSQNLRSSENSWHALSLQNKLNTKKPLCPKTQKNVPKIMTRHRALESHSMYMQYLSIDIISHMVRRHTYDDSKN